MGMVQQEPVKLINKAINLSKLFYNHFSFFNIYPFLKFTFKTATLLMLTCTKFILNCDNINLSYMGPSMKIFLYLYNIEDSLRKCLREFFFKSINKNTDSCEFPVVFLPYYFTCSSFTSILLYIFCYFYMELLYDSEYLQKSISSCKLQQYILAKILIMECRWHGIFCFRINSFC